MPLTLPSPRPPPLAAPITIPAAGVAPALIGPSPRLPNREGDEGTKTDDDRGDVKALAKALV